MLGEDGYAYYMEIEGAHNWQLTHMVTGSMTSPAFALEGTAAHEENGGWHYTLLPGESYTTEPAVFGRVKGGYEEVCAELVAYKRAVSLTHHANDTIPVVFNDYMNCLWGAPSDKKLLHLIGAAADVGCEVFCIDAGWHKNASPGTYGAAGDWIVADERFGDDGLAGIFTHMRERGLTPGVWFEWDTVNASAAAHDLDDDCLLKRYGKPFPRAFFNFQNEKVRAHLTARVDALYSMGVRYIKNDYNQTTGIGCDCGDLAPAEGLIRNYHAFCDFVDRLRAKYPDLVIENCGSGACRADNGTLAHFHLQSTSDQEFYYWYPSVIIGSMAHFAPEKAGIWSYPMAVRLCGKALRHIKECVPILSPLTRSSRQPRKTCGSVPMETRRQDWKQRIEQRRILLCGGLARNRIRCASISRNTATQKRRRGTRRNVTIPLRTAVSP